MTVGTLDQKQRTTHLKADSPCEFGLPVTALRLSHYLDCEAVGDLFPACGNPNCSNLDHWFFSKGDGRKTSTGWKEQRVLAVFRTDLNLSVSGLAHTAGVSPAFVRKTLERHGLELPRSGVGTDGKTYSTSREQARLTALARALSSALPHLNGVALDAANELLETLREHT